MFTLVTPRRIASFSSVGATPPASPSSRPPASLIRWISVSGTAEPPCKTLYDYADAMLQEPGVLSNSVILGFPYADVEEMGSSAIVVTDNDFARAETLVLDLSRFW